MGPWQYPFCQAYSSQRCMQNLLNQLRGYQPLHVHFLYLMSQSDT